MAEVSDNLRATFPYQCVGKLLYTKNLEHCAGTAFGVNVKGAKNIIFTSASNLCDEKGQAKSIEFIPAMRNSGYQPYGSFKQIDGGKGISWFVHPSWDPIIKPGAFDLGAIKIGLNKNGKDVGEVMPLLNVDFDVQLDASVKWNIVWYSQLKMFESQSIYKKTISNGSILALHDSEIIPIVASGAPWLVNGNHMANGHYIGHAAEKACSPYYNLGLIRELLNQM